MDLAQKLNDCLDSGLLPAQRLVCRLRLSEAAHSVSATTDPRYLPFYYYLGKEVTAEKLVEFGFGDGLVSSCLLIGCDSVTNFLAFQRKPKQFYSPRIGRSNILDHYKKQFAIYMGEYHDQSFVNAIQATQWDLALIHESANYDYQMGCLRLIWPQISSGGMIIMDGINSDSAMGRACRDFCKVSNRNLVECKTRYGVGIIYK